MLTFEQRLSIKTAVGRGSELIGGHKLLSADSRLMLKSATAAQRVSEYANPVLADERYVPLDVAVEFDARLMALGHGPLNLANAARLLGLRLIKERAATAIGRLRGHFMEFARESGEALAAAGTVADDKSATAAQLRRAIKEVDEAVLAGLEMRDVLEQRLLELEAERDDG